MLCTRRTALATFGLIGMGGLLTLGARSRPGAAFAQPVAASPNDVAFVAASSVRIQQLVGDVDVTRMQQQGSAYWHPTDKRPGQENSVGYFPGGPPVKRADGEVWSEPGSTLSPSPFPDGPTPQLAYYYNVTGSDKGRCFTGPDGNLIFVFGDIRGQTQAPFDTIGYSDTADPEPGSGPVGMDLWCYTSNRPSFAKQPKNESDPHPPASTGPYTLLAFPSNPGNRPNPLNLDFSVQDMGVDNSPFSGVYVPRADDPSKSATYVTFRFRTLAIAGTPPAPPSEPTMSAEWFARLQAESGVGTANVLTKFNAAYATSPRSLNPASVDPQDAFEYVRVISQTPFKQTQSGTIVPLQSALPVSPCFINTALHTYDASYPSYASSGLGSLPASGGFVLSYGTGTIRGPLTVVQPTLVDGRTDYLPTTYDLSTVFLSAQDYADLETSAPRPRTFNGLGPDGTSAQWTSSIDPADAYPVLGGAPQAFAYRGIGDMSVACLKNQVADVPELWLMMCDGSQSNGWPFGGIQLFWATTPWGPWKVASQTGTTGVFETSQGQGDSASGGFIQLPLSDARASGNGLNGPAIGAEKNALDARGLPANSAAFKVYGPMLVEKFCKLVADPSSPSSALLTVYWTLCTWIPYYVVLMKSQFTVS